jgi:catechol 2,3-dioxygenase-like lactoylglutathione lyase family enzyme
MKVVGLHHFAIPMPVGGEERARAFYVGVLGLTETPKPVRLASDGGCWFQLPDGRQVHLQSAPMFQPLLTPHPALTVDDIDDAAAALVAAGHQARWDERWDGVRRFFTADPFNNRVEILQAAAVGL